jgi:hypothetical protein
MISCRGSSNDSVRFKHMGGRGEDVEEEEESLLVQIFF